MENADYTVLRTAAGTAYGAGRLASVAVARAPGAARCARLAPPRPARQIEPRDSTGRGRIAPARRADPRRLQAISPAKLVEIALPAVSPQPGDARLEPGPRAVAPASPRRGRWRSASRAAIGSSAAVTWRPSGLPAARTCTCSAGGWPAGRRQSGSARHPAAPPGWAASLGRMHAAASPSRSESGQSAGRPAHDDLAVYLVDTGRRAHRAAARPAGGQPSWPAWPSAWRPIPGSREHLLPLPAGLRRGFPAGNHRLETLWRAVVRRAAAPYGASIVAESKCCRTGNRVPVAVADSRATAAVIPGARRPSSLRLCFLGQHSAAPPGLLARRGRKCRCGRPTSLGTGRRRPGQQRVLRIAFRRLSHAAADGDRQSALHLAAAGVRRTGRPLPDRSAASPPRTPRRRSGPRRRFRGRHSSNSRANSCKIWSPWRCPSRR